MGCTVRHKNSRKKIMAEQQHKIKLVAVGDGAVGKTCMLISYVRGEFPEEYVPTVFENYNAKVDTSVGKVTLDLWDTAGQEEYDEIRKLAYKKVNGFLICFSIVSPTSFANIILVGTKADLRDDEMVKEQLAQNNEKPVSNKEAEDLAKELGNAPYVECSALTGQGLQEMMQQSINLSLSTNSGSGSDAKKGGGEGSKPKCCIL